MNDLRFPTALQMVLSLAVAREAKRRCTSMELATGLGANPALVRALLVPLSRANIVTTTIGKNGGVELARAPEEISLREVYFAIIDDKRLFERRTNVPSVCVVSTNIGSFFEELATEVEDAMLTKLGQRTVAQSLMEIRRIDAARIANVTEIVAD
ncbi:Rrf2 family transcriptional regulator [Mesorhizobium sp.]|uniref:Rrf2 family transcriptional regulator n=1 Tax=Mesorhizobium sp. TaxID=1871066 RepID=UPI000FE2B76A|nr:Rrf2 family transcriptional regulator [Mesorhizobium sp.]RWH72890.1 MAG: Rrf2 family transcriptional regulator [Mesorhizobium sp.]RWL34224.1 MAG: Rrf2 family transcriptional regulator [Mesorhizobium sp.]RWL35640.1 MAG: Rrf2 family transcriptional regulator [Mesorhizobium sp.]RWL41050.1 MAG: Rrf2 family transcriptional regulator [Mesorhizobium sp.]RWL52184.1 MAG: Rrf2 family transcriptional regulator [Mesorhizobium sp.]